MDMIQFRESFDKYIECREKFYTDLDKFFMNETGYLFSFELNDDLDDVKLSVYVYVNDGDYRWLSDYHDLFCECFGMELFNTFKGINGRLVYEYV